MLDLKKLERKLDTALKKETDESLTKWLFEKRNKELLNYLGEGTIEMIKIQSKVFQQIKINDLSFYIDSNLAANLYLTKVAKLKHAA